MPTISKHYLHETTNENGNMLIDFAVKEKSLFTKSTHSQPKDIHKGTWRPPNAKTINQIDHVLEKDQRKCITHIRTNTRPELDSEH